VIATAFHAPDSDAPASGVKPASGGGVVVVVVVVEVVLVVDVVTISGIGSVVVGAVVVGASVVVVVLVVGAADVVSAIVVVVARSSVVDPASSSSSRSSDVEGEEGDGSSWVLELAVAGSSPQAARSSAPPRTIVLHQFPLVAISPPSTVHPLIVNFHEPGWVRIFVIYQLLACFYEMKVGLVPG